MRPGQGEGHGRRRGRGRSSRGRPASRPTAGSSGAGRRAATRAGRPPGRPGPRSPTGEREARPSRRQSGQATGPDRARRSGSMGMPPDGRHGGRSRVSTSSGQPGAPGPCSSPVWAAAGLRRATGARPGPRRGRCRPRPGSRRRGRRYRPRRHRAARPPPARPGRCGRGGPARTAESPVPAGDHRLARAARRCRGCAVSSPTAAAVSSSSSSESRPVVAVAPDRQADQLVAGPGQTRPLAGEVGAAGDQGGPAVDGRRPGDEEAGAGQRRSGWLPRGSTG